MEILPALLGAALGGDDGAMTRLGPLAEIVRNPPPDCSACGAALDHAPPIIGLMVPAALVSCTTLGFACCARCYAAGPDATILRLGAYLAAVGVSRPICAAPEAVQ